MSGHPLFRGHFFAGCRIKNALKCLSLERPLFSGRRGGLSRGGPLYVLFSAKVNEDKIEI
jgi:hypothetical protein